MNEPVAGGEGEIRLVGTAHVSRESVERVKAAIDERRPDVVAVELDEARYRQMKGDGPDDLDPSDVLRGNTVFQFLAYWMLSYVQTRLGERFGIEPGADMKEAIEVAEGHGIPVALVDRDINVTIQRFWARLSIREKLSLVGGLLVGLAPPLYLGATVGVVLGLLAGIVIWTAGAGTLGVDGATFDAVLGATAVEVVGAGVIGVVAGLVVWGLASDVIGGLLGAVGSDTIEARLIASLAVGIVGTVAVVLGGGLAIGPVALTAGSVAGVGEVALSIAAGVVTFGALGTVAGVGLERAYDDELEELDEFDVERLTDTDVVSAMMEEFRRFSPGGAEALIDERDAYIAHKLHGLRAQGRDVVAVVGAGHVEGIESHLEDPDRLPPIESLTTRTKRRRVSPLKVASYLFMIGFFAFFGLLALAGVGDPVLIELFVAWFLFNGVFAFGLAKLAGARWSSATAGGLVAWLTSVNPLLAPGWIAGYVELRHRTVSVGDIGTLNDLLSDEARPIGAILGDMFDVPLFRLIVVVAMTNVGSMVASVLFFFVVVPWLAVDLGGADALMGELVRGAENGAAILRDALL